MLPKGSIEKMHEDEIIGAMLKCNFGPLDLYSDLDPIIVAFKLFNFFIKLYNQ